MKQDSEAVKQFMKADHITYISNRFFEHPVSLYLADKKSQIDEVEGTLKIGWKLQISYLGVTNIIFFFAGCVPLSD